MTSQTNVSILSTKELAREAEDSRPLKLACPLFVPGTRRPVRMYRRPIQRQGRIVTCRKERLPKRFFRLDHPSVAVEIDKTIAEPNL